MEIYNVSNLYPEPMKEDPQRVKAIQHIERKFKALRTFQSGLSRIQIEKNQCTILGIMSLAKELELITTEEYESYYEELFSQL